ncbi:helix-turn-helix transcriptional regulator [Streptomyces sp. NPDC008079]|uniref:helix-turn-helix transcriptional regulator n=1 Tax=Streptomyces sp. NPDC008079 TaxID=3364806 RepID=UPI0036EBFDF2
MDDSEPRPATGWTFLTNHARVLAVIARDPGSRVRDIAARCLLTERAVQKIIADLESEGYLTHTRVGRSNLYEIPAGTVLRHPADMGPTVADLLSILTVHRNGSEPEPAAKPEPAAGSESAAGSGSGSGAR